MKERYNASFLISVTMLVSAVCWALCIACSDADEGGATADSDTSTAASNISAGTDTAVDDQTGDGDAGASCAIAATREECEAMTGCSAIWGWKVDLEGDCWGPMDSFIECVVGDHGCEEAEGHALDPATGECYVFPNLCLPNGWTEVDIYHTSCHIESDDLCAE